MEFYWDAFLSEIRDGEVYRAQTNDDGEIVNVRAYLEDLSPRELLCLFYGWLEDKGLFKENV
jgi:hypothetical protein